MGISKTFLEDEEEIKGPRCLMGYQSDEAEADEEERAKVCENQTKSKMLKIMDGLHSQISN